MQRLHKCSFSRFPSAGRDHLVTSPPMQSCIKVNRSGLSLWICFTTHIPKINGFGSAGHRS